MLIIKDSFKEEKRIKFIIRFFLILAVIIFSLYILNFHLIFLGKIKVNINFDKENYLISHLKGGATEPEMNLKNKEKYQEFTPSAYSEIFVPPYADKLDVQVKTDALNSFVFSYQTKDKQARNIIATHNDLINLNWQLEEINDYFVLRNPNKPSLSEQDIKKSLKELSSDIGVYRADYVLENLMLEEINDYFDKTNKYFWNLNLPLRGEHDLEVYVAEDGILEMEVDYKQKIVEPEDLDGEGEEKIGFGAYININGEEKIFSKNSEKEIDKIKIKEENIKPGKYILRLKHDNDITLSNIKTHNIFLVTNEMTLNNPDYNIDFYALASNLCFYTFHGGGVQSISINNKQVNLNFEEKLVFENYKEPESPDEGNEEVGEKIKELLNFKAERADFQVYSYERGIKFFPADFPLNIYKILNNQAINDNDLKDFIEEEILENVQEEIGKEETEEDVEDEETEEKKPLELKKFNYIIFNATDEFVEILNNPELATEQKNMYNLRLDTDNLDINENNFSLSFNTGQKTRVKDIEVVYYRSFMNYLKNKFSEF